MCSLAAAHASEDPRVMTEGYPLPFSRGLKYAMQIWQIRKPLYGPMSLHEIQLLCVRPTQSMYLLFRIWSDHRCCGMMQM